MQPFQVASWLLCQIATHLSTILFANFHEHQKLTWKNSEFLSQYFVPNKEMRSFERLQGQSDRFHVTLDFSLLCALLIWVDRVGNDPKGRTGVCDGWLYYRVLHSKCTLPSAFVGTGAGRHVQPTVLGAGLVVQMWGAGSVVAPRGSISAFFIAMLPSAERGVLWPSVRPYSQRWIGRWVSSYTS